MNDEARSDDKYIKTRTKERCLSDDPNSVDAEVTRQQLAIQNESWIKSYWRPGMGWLYMIMCAFDFIIFPLIMIMSPVVGAIIGVNIPYNEWKSLTLSNGGMIHLAFGAILGVAAYTRGQEKLLGRQ